MRTSSLIWNFRFLCILLMISISANIGLFASQTDTETFYQALKNQDDPKALSTGNTIFAQLEHKYGSDACFLAFKSKLSAAEFLAKQMAQQLRAATNKQMLSTTGELFSGNNTAAKKSQLSVAPAKNFYESSIKTFSAPIQTENISNEDKTFLAQYYNLKLRILISDIAKAGQALSIAAPDFAGTHDYVLVLPLLHTSADRAINIDVLPLWMRRADELDMFSDSCLLHFGLPFQAMSLKMESAKIRNISFSQLDFYRSAAERCGTTQPHIAAGCLERAVDIIKNKDIDTSISLQFDLEQLWLDSKNYALAAGQAKKIFETHPNHKQAGKAIWFYYYSLSRTNNTEQILADIDNALNDKRCRDYKPKMMYIKWWALRRTRDQKARVAAIEHELLELYGDDPMVAPILLSQATDLMARQNYPGAYEILNELVQKFPTTNAGREAEKMILKYKEKQESKPGS